MSLPGLNHGALVVESGTESFVENKNVQMAEQGADAALTLRAVVVVTCLGAGFWYLLWKLALVFVAGR